MNKVPSHLVVVLQEASKHIGQETITYRTPDKTDAYRTFVSDILGIETFDEVAESLVDHPALHF